VDGIYPHSLLLSKSNRCNFLRNPIEAVIEPVIKFGPMSNTVKLTRFPISRDIFPEIWFSPRVRTWSLMERFAIEFGSMPTKGIDI